MSEHTVHVWNEPVVVTLYKESKSVWVASGDYHGEPLSRSGVGPQNTKAASHSPSTRRRRSSRISSVMLVCDSRTSSANGE